MDAENQGRRELWEKIAALRFPEGTDRRMQCLMDRNNDGLLNPSEKEELESLVKANQIMSLLRAKALRFLGRNP